MFNIYSEFNKLTIDVYTDNIANVQLPPLKRDTSALSGIYIHTLIDANMYSSLPNTDISADISGNAQIPEIVNGWSLYSDYSQNDFLRYALHSICMMPHEEPEEPDSAHTKVFGVLQCDNQQLNLPAILHTTNLPPEHASLRLKQIPTLHGPAWIGVSKHHPHRRNAYDKRYTPQIDCSTHYRHAIPGLIFRFDTNGRFNAIVAQPLEKAQHDIRTTYINDLFKLLPTSVNFNSFKAFVLDYAHKYLCKPCILQYDNAQIKYPVYISKPITTKYTPHRVLKTYSNAVTADSARIAEAEASLISFLKSTWSTFKIRDAIGVLPVLIKTDQLCNYDRCTTSKPSLQTIYIVTVAAAFNVPLHVYKAIEDNGDKVLVVPDDLFAALKDDLLSILIDMTVDYPILYDGVILKDTATSAMHRLQMSDGTLNTLQLTH